MERIALSHALAAVVLGGIGLLVAAEPKEAKRRASLPAQCRAAKAGRR